MIKAVQGDELPLCIGLENRFQEKVLRGAGPGRLLPVLPQPLSGRLRLLMGWLWPEQMTLLGVLGWQIAGPTMVVLCLVALGVVGRLLLTVRGVRKLLPPPQRSSHSSARA